MMKSSNRNPCWVTFSLEVESGMGVAPDDRKAGEDPKSGDACA